MEFITLLEENLLSIINTSEDKEIIIEKSIIDPRNEKVENTNINSNKNEEQDEISNKVAAALIELKESPKQPPRSIERPIYIPPIPFNEKQTNEANFIDSSLTNLINIIENSDEDQLLLGNSKLIEIIINLLTNYKLYSLRAYNNYSITASSLWVLVKLCRRTMSKDTKCENNLLIIQKYLKEIIKSIDDYEFENITTLPAMWLIMVLASDSSERQIALANAGATASVVAAINLHINNKEIVEMTCRATRNLAADDDGSAKLVEEGICNGLVLALNTYQDDVEICEAVMWAVVNLACDGNVSTIFGSVGGCDAVVKSAGGCLLNSFSGTQASCWAIRNLACSSAYNYTLLAATSVCETILKMLEIHAVSHNSPLDFPFDDYTDIAEAGLWVLANLSCDKELSTRLCKLGAGDAVVRIANSFGQGRIKGVEGQVQIEGILTPSNRSKENYYQLLIPGPVAEACLWAIRNLASGNLENQLLLGESGVCEVIFDIMDQYIEREGMLEASIGAFINLAYECDVMKERLARLEYPNKLLPYVCDAMRRHDGCAGVAEFGMKLIVVASINHEENRLMSLSSKACHLAIKSMQAHKEDDELVRIACDVLLQLYYTNPEEREFFVAAGLITSDVRAAVPKDSATIEDIMKIWDTNKILEALDKTDNIKA